MKKIKSLIVYILTILSLVSTSKAVEVTSLVSMVAKDTDQKTNINETFRGFSNFHSSRVRLFFDSEVNENTTVFIQLLMDTYSTALYGAYVRFEHVGTRFLNIQAGLIPNTVGTYAARTYSNVNPLIGTPLLYNYHSSFKPMRPDPVGTIDDLILSRDNRQRSGLPVIYDACWNSGVEFYGNHGRLSYSLGLLAGSLTKPTQEQTKNSPQLTTRLAYTFDPGFVLGLSAYHGTYLLEGMVADPIPSGKSIHDYSNSGIGYDLNFARGYLDIHSELFVAQWQYPNLPDLKVASGYFEAKYKFIPGWFLAGRYGLYEPNKVTLSDGTESKWDYAVARYEFGIGHKVSRNVTAKLVGQLNRFEEASYLNSDLYAFQLVIDIH